MQNIIPIVSSQEIKTVKPNSKNIKEDLSANDTKEFVSILFEQIKEKSIKIDIHTEKTDIINTFEKNSKDNSTPKAADSFLLNEILNLIQNLNDSQNTKPSFPKFSDKLKSILKNEEATNDFKSIKSFDDIIKFSKKYNLNLEKIEITKAKKEDLKNSFPKLEEKGFFNTEEKDKNIQTLNKNELPKQDLSKRAENINLMLKNLSENKDIGNNKSSTKILQSLLENVDENSEKVIYKSLEEDKRDKVKEYIKKNDSEINEKYEKQITTEKNKKVERHINDKNKTENLSNTKKEKNPVNHQTVLTANEDKIPKKEKQPTIKNHIKNINNKESLKKEKITVINEVKKEKIHTNQNRQDQILNKIKTDRHNFMQNQNQNQESKDISETEKQDIKDEIKTDTKNENQPNRVEIKTSHKLENIKPNQNIQTKETFNNFVNDLKEKIEQYKPPIMKVQMALNPKNLGEVEVTILNRGNSLHVNITSNTNTMSLFTQNQAEFKNSLVNMGFTNLEMNFSDQREGNKEQNKEGSSNKNFEEGFEIENIQESTSLELVLPRYI